MDCLLYISERKTENWILPRHHSQPTSKPESSIKMFFKSATSLKSESICEDQNSISAVCNKDNSLDDTKHSKNTQDVDNSSVSHHFKSNGDGLEFSRHSQNDPEFKEDKTLTLSESSGVVSAESGSGVTGDCNSGEQLRLDRVSCKSEISSDSLSQKSWSLSDVYSQESVSLQEASGQEHTVLLETSSQKSEPPCDASSQESVPSQSSSSEIYPGFSDRVSSCRINSGRWFE